MFCCLTMRMSDSNGPPPCVMPLARSEISCVNSPMTSTATVASIATGPLRNVLNITLKLITNTIVSQMPK